MLYLVAIVCPPLACLLAGKPGQAVLNFFLWAFCLWVPGTIHAFIVVAQAANERRHRETIEAMAGIAGGVGRINRRGRYEEDDEDDQPRRRR